MQILIVPESMKVRARTSNVCLLPWEHFLLLTHSTSPCESALIEWRPGRICSLAQRRRQKSTLGKESIVTCPKVTLSPRAPDQLIARYQMAPPGILKGKKALLSGALSKEMVGAKKRDMCVSCPQFPLGRLCVSWEAVLCCFSVLFKQKIHHSITLYREWDGSSFITKGTEENKKHLPFNSISSFTKRM